MTEALLPEQAEILRDVGVGNSADTRVLVRCWECTRNIGKLFQPVWEHEDGRLVTWHLGPVFVGTQPKTEPTRVEITRRLGPNALQRRVDLDETDQYLVVLSGSTVQEQLKVWCNKCRGYGYVTRRDLAVAANTAQKKGDVVTIRAHRLGTMSTTQ
jgi:hypothetical protein